MSVSILHPLPAPAPGSTLQSRRSPAPCWQHLHVARRGDARPEYPGPLREAPETNWLCKGRLFEPFPVDTRSTTSTATYSPPPLPWYHPPD